MRRRAICTWLPWPPRGAALIDGPRRDRSPTIRGTCRSGYQHSRIAISSADKAEAALIGDISRVGMDDTVAGEPLASAAFLAIWRTYFWIMWISIHEDLAKTEGVKLKLYSPVYLLSATVIVALGVNLVGGHLIVALVAIPAASARYISQTLLQFGFGRVWRHFGDRRNPRRQPLLLTYSADILTLQRASLQTTRDLTWKGGSIWPAASGNFYFAEM